MDLLPTLHTPPSCQYLRVATLICGLWGVTKNRSPITVYFHHQQSFPLAEENNRRQMWHIMNHED
jgi:hypothetical protein